MMDKKNVNIEAEQSLLGSIIMNNDLLSILGVEEDDFADTNHQSIFNKIKSNLENSNPANKLSLKGFFQDLPEDDNYLEVVLGSIQDFITPSEIAKTLRELSNKRKLCGLSLSLGEMSSDEAKNSLEIKDAVLEQLEDLTIKAGTKKTVKIGDAIREAFGKEKAKLFHTGYKNIDNITSGFDFGSLVILAGRPSMGKSSLAMNIAIRVAKGIKDKQEPIPALFISLESSNDQFSRRVIANLASLNLTKLRNDNINTQHEYEAFQRGVQEADTLPLEIKEEGGLTLAKLRYEIKRFVNRTKGKFVVIDYIQLIKHSTKNGRVNDITEITNTLKALALEFGIVILGLSQLSRAVEQREDKRPMLSDLRDSGSLEQDADVVMFAFRPSYYVEREKPEDPEKMARWQSEMERLKGVAYAIVAKVREGQCGDARLYFEGEFQRFNDLEN